MFLWRGPNTPRSLLTGVNLHQANPVISRSVRFAVSLGKDARWGSLKTKKLWWLRHWRNEDPDIGIHIPSAWRSIGFDLTTAA